MVIFTDLHRSVVTFILLSQNMKITSLESEKLRNFGTSTKEFVRISHWDFQISLSQFPSMLLLIHHSRFKMADFGDEDLFAVFDNVETNKKNEKAAEVTDGSAKDSVKRIFLQRGEKRGHEDSIDGVSLDDGADEGDKLKRVKKPDDERYSILKFLCYCNYLYII